MKQTDLVEVLEELETAECEYRHDGYGNYQTQCGQTVEEDQVLTATVLCQYCLRAKIVKK